MIEKKKYQRGDLNFEQHSLVRPVGVIAEVIGIAAANPNQCSALRGFLPTKSVFLQFVVARVVDSERGVVQHQTC